MKTIPILIIAAAMAAGTLSAFAQSSALEELMKKRAAEQAALGGAPAGESSPAGADAATGAEATPVTPAPDRYSVEPANMAEPIIASGSSTNGISLNFNNAPLSVVLRYISSAAGFHIVLEANPRGNVTVMSSNPMSRDEVVDLLNTVLNRNNLAAIRKGDFLTIMDKNEAKTAAGLPVSTWTTGDPADIPDNDMMVTKILPIKFVDARQLATDLSSFISPQATVVPNDAANSIVIVDTQSNIRHLTEIIKAIDSSAEGETQIRVFALTNANPSDVASALSGIFPNNTGGGRGGGGGNVLALFGAGGRGGRGGAAGGGSAARISKQTQVIAVADMRTQSVIVTAEKNLMAQIEATVHELDVASEHDTDVHVVPLSSEADPYALLQILQQTFPASANNNRTTANQNTQSAIDTRAQNAARTATVGGNTSSSTGLGSATGGRSGVLR